MAETSEAIEMKKKLDEIIEMTEQDYFATLYDANKNRLALVKSKEFEEYKRHGFNIRFYYNKTREFMYYQLFQTEPIGFKYGGNEK